MKKRLYSRFFLPGALVVLVTLVSSSVSAQIFVTDDFSQQTTISPSVSVPLCSFMRSLFIGVTSTEVLCLQQYLNSAGFTVALSGAGSPGNESMYFGAKTKRALVSWQTAHNVPGTGLFGPLSRAEYAKAIVGFSPTPRVAPSPIVVVNPSPVAPSPTPTPLTPVITNVYPTEVKSGATVIITGKNFTLTGNSVVLGDGPLARRFDNLFSPDGKTISFTYLSPEVKTMTEAEIRALPPSVVAQIENPLKAVGKTIADALVPYKGMQTEAEVDAFLRQNSHSLNELYHFFWVTVQNQNGEGISQGPLLRGMRRLAFEMAREKAFPLALSTVGKEFKKLVNKLLPTAHAQYGGGYTSGVVMQCTCASGSLTFQTDINGSGTGLYYFAPGFQPSVGTGLVAGPWLGGYLSGAGICIIGATPYCVELTANLPLVPIGFGS